MTCASVGFYAFQRNCRFWARACISTQKKSSKKWYISWYISMTPFYNRTLPFITWNSARRCLSSKSRWISLCHPRDIVCLQKSSKIIAVRKSQGIELQLLTKTGAASFVTEWNLCKIMYCKNENWGYSKDSKSNHQHLNLRRFTFFKLKFVKSPNILVVF